MACQVGATRAITVRRYYYGVSPWTAALVAFEVHWRCPSCASGNVCTPNPEERGHYILDGGPESNDVAQDWLCHDCGHSGGGHEFRGPWSPDHAHDVGSLWRGEGPSELLKLIEQERERIARLEI